MGNLRRWALPVLLAVLLVAEVTTAAVGASGIRADQRKAAALARERRAVADYLKAVHPLLLQVFDAVQPLQDASDAFAHPASGQTGARDDVLAHSGAEASLAASAKKLAALHAPRTLSTKSAALSTHLAALQGAAKTLAAATKVHGDKTGFVAAFDVGFDKLLTAESFWHIAVVDLYDSPVPTPSADRAQAQGRKTPTKGGFLHVSDLACARAGDDLSAAGVPRDGASVLRIYPKRAQAIRAVRTRLLAARSDATSAAFLHRLTVQLTALGELPAALDAITVAVRKQDLAALTAADKRFDAALITVRDLSRSYGSYGATVCRELFDVDDVLSGTDSGLSA